MDSWFGVQKVFSGACLEVEIQVKKKASYVSHLPDDMVKSINMYLVFRSPLNRSSGGNLLQS